MSAPLLYLIAGEPSGDALGAGLMRALRARLPGVQFGGIGGEAMEKEGLQSLFSYRELSIMGFLEVVPHIPKMLKRITETAEDIANRQPAAIITIDSPGFNFRLAKKLKDMPQAANIKRVHYVAPSVWAYKPKRAAKTAALYHLLLTLLPFEPPYFEKEGLKSVFVGHPVLWQNWDGDGTAFRRLHNIPADAPILLVLPGSRRSEVKKHLKVFLKSALALKKYVPVVIAGSLVQDMVKEIVPSGTRIASMSEKKDAFAAASLALSKSGTITLELAAAGVPTLMAHRINPLSHFLIRRMIKIPHASLVNIAAKKEIIPEFVQDYCSPEFLTNALHAYSSPESRSTQRKEASDAIRLMRGDNKTAPDVMAAGAILDLINT